MYAKCARKVEKIILCNEFQKNSEGDTRLTKTILQTYRYRLRKEGTKSEESEMNILPLNLHVIVVKI